MDINYYIELALQQAKKAFDLDEVPVGSVLVDNKTNKIISASHNMTESLKNPTKHAEMIVIENGCKKNNSRYLNNTSIFITLEPCAMCAAAISEAKINKIYYSAYDENKGAIESTYNLYNNKKYFVPEYYGGINENESSLLLKRYFKLKRKINAKYSKYT